MIRVKAVKEIRYGGKKYLSGQHFEAREKHVKVLTATKKVVLAKEKEEKEKPTEAPKSAQSGKTAASKPQPKPLPPSGEYSRRDMTAEGSKK